MNELSLAVTASAPRRGPRAWTRYSYKRLMVERYDLLEVVPWMNGPLGWVTLSHPALKGVSTKVGN